MRHYYKLHSDGDTHFVVQCDCVTTQSVYRSGIHFNSQSPVSPSPQTPRLSNKYRGTGTWGPYHAASGANLLQRYGEPRDRARAHRKRRQQRAATELYSTACVARESLLCAPLPARCLPLFEEARRSLSKPSEALRSRAYALSSFSNSSGSVSAGTSLIRSSRL